MKLLLHTCCGPCFLGVWEELSGHSDVTTSLYYFNPNISPEEEFEKRYDNLVIASKNRAENVIKVDYQNSRFSDVVNDQNDIFPIRCLDCYRLRLDGVAKYASDNGFDSFSTTLLVSPYQQHEKLREIGDEVANKYAIKFYYADWRPYFREGQEDAKELQIYRQKYCGCGYSLAESKAQRGK